MLPQSPIAVKHGSLPRLSAIRTLLPALAVALASCASHRDLTHFDLFQRQVGAELRTERQTYIYDFPHSPQSLWNHTHKFGRAGEAGEMVMQETEPKAVCPTGSTVRLDRVRFSSKFDSPEVIEAFGVIQCSGKLWQFRYVWGLAPNIHGAPWESEIYDPQKTRRVL